MFNLIEKIRGNDISNPITSICKCNHKWSWHYINSNNNKCYAHKIISGNECSCKGYKE